MLERAGLLPAGGAPFGLMLPARRREPAPAFAAPDIDLAAPLLAEDVWEAFAEALVAPIARWTGQAQADLAGIADLDGATEVALRLATTLPVATLAERAADALALAGLLGRASVVAEAEVDGLTFADPGDIEFKGAPFDEAMEFLRQKVALPQAEWDSLTREGHDRAFVVAGNLRVEVAADIQASVIRALEGGTGLAGFQVDFDRILASGKWTGDPRLKDDAGRRAWRTKTIFMTNMRTAHAAGRRQQQRALVDVLPFWQYRHAATRTPKRPRAAHLRLDGLTLPADDPIWGEIYAPNGWMCSCAIRAITAAAADRASAHDRTPPTAGEIAEAVPQEWRHAPGDTWERGLVPREEAGMLDVSGARKPAGRQPDLTPLTEIAVPMPALPAAAEGDGEARVAQFLSKFGATPSRAARWRDAAGQEIVVSRQLFEAAGGALKIDKRGRGRSVLALAETLRDPDEIWVDWQTRQDGAPRLVRSYLRYDPQLAGLNVFHWSEDAWAGVTAYPLESGRRNKPWLTGLERARHGALLYRRGK